MLDKMDRQYKIFLKNMMEILKEKYKSYSEILWLFQSIDKHNISMYLNDNEVKDLKHDTPMTEAINVLFKKIYSNWKFFDYGMINEVVEVSESESLKQLVQDYTKKINDVLTKYDLNSLYETTPENICKRDRNTSIFKIKCEVGKVYHEQWISIKTALHKCFGVSEGALQFDSIVRGCVILVCKISIQAKYHLLKLKIKTNQLKPLATMKIASLIIDDEVELKVPSECITEVTTCHCVSNYVHSSYMYYLCTYV